MNINVFTMTPEEAKAVLSDKRFVIATREQVELAEAAVAERDRLRAENESLKTGDIGEAYNCGEQKVMALLAAANERNDRLRAERDAARDENAGLREVLAQARNVFGCIIDSPESSTMYATLGAAIARTPSQHRARIEAAVLRKAAGKFWRDNRSDNAARFHDWLVAEAERLEKEAGNG